MRRTISKALSILFIAVVLFGSAATAFAQSATTGGISGTIYDPKGAVLAGAEVSVVNTATGDIRTTTANTSGEYRISDLPPGVYTVTVTAAGFETYKTDNVPVAVGTLSDIAPKLTVGNVAETVEVTDETPLMHTQSSEISSVVDQNMIDNLPINGHRYSNFALLTPGVVVGDPDGLGLLSFRGVNYLLNNSTVDGMDDNQAYFSEQRGRTTVSYSFALAAVQEFQVNTSNYSAEYGRAAGGVINTVTKSGTNSFHGELYFFDRDNDFGSTNPYTDLTTVPPGGQAVTTVVKPKDWRKSWGFGMGGALIKDKLFWFYAYDQQRKNYPGISRFTQNAINNGVYAQAFLSSAPNCGGGGTVSTGAYTYTDSNGTVHNLTSTSGQPQNQGPDSGGFAACQVAHALGVSYAAGLAYYDQGLAIIQSFTGEVPRRADQVNNFPRLDWQINDKNRLTLEYSRFRGSGFSNYQTASSVNVGNHSFGDSYVKLDFGIMRLFTQVSSSITNELRFQFGRDFEYQVTSTPGPNEAQFASVSPANPQDAAAMPLTRIGYYYDSSNYFRAGKNSNFDAKANPNERRMQGEDIITWSHGKHTSKAGIEVNRVFDYVSNLDDESGDYRFPYSWNFIADYIHAATGIGGTGYSPNFTELVQGFGNPASNEATTDYAGFITDDWRILPRLTLTLGVRYEYEYIPLSSTPVTAATPLWPASTVNAAPGGPTVGSSIPALLGAVNNKPDDRNNIQPRFGFNWDVYGDGKTVLRGGYGLYNGRIINSVITSAYNAQIGPGSQQQLSGGTTGGCGPTAPWPQLIVDQANFQQTCSSFGPTINYFAKNFQNPQVEEVDVALEQKIGWNTVFSVMYMSSLGRELSGAFDQNNVCAGDFFNQTQCNNSISTHYYTVINSDGVIPAPNNYVTFPHGGKPSPLASKGIQTGGILAVGPFYGSGAKFSSAVDGLAKICSCLNSSYNALAVQMNKRMSNSVQFLMNYTWAHSLDYNPYIGNNIPFGGPYDPTNVHDEYGNGQLDVRDRFVGSMIWRPETHFHGWKNYVGNGWQVSPLVQLQTGLPYTPVTTGANPTGGYGQGSNGSGGVSASAGGLSRLLITGRNQSYLPKSAVADIRVGKVFFFPQLHGSRPRLDLNVSVYNVLNHQNITKSSQTAYCLDTGTTTASNQNCPGTLTPAATAIGGPASTFGTPAGSGSPTNPAQNNYLIAQPNYGTYINANSTQFQLTPREVELSARFYF